MPTGVNRTVRLDRDKVAEASLCLLDKVGLDGLTLRGVAAELGVQAPALYWHFANKQDLLDHVADAMTRPWLEAVPASSAGRPWDEWLADVGRSYRMLLLAHRDGARLVAGTRPLPDSLPLLDRCIAAFEASSGCSSGQALQCLITVTAYVRGFVLDEDAERVRTQADLTSQPHTMGTQAIGPPPPLAPHLDAAIDAIGSPSGAVTFEYGLRLIVGGVRSALGSDRA
jgi:TetR/AcrR family transcriptional regulator, tetracycline repressor protein